MNNSNHQRVRDSCSCSLLDPEEALGFFTFVMRRNMPGGHVTGRVTVTARI